MSDVQRYTQRDIAELEFPGAEDEGFDDVTFVLFTDHERAVSEAKIEAIQNWLKQEPVIVANAAAAEREACAQAVEALMDPRNPLYYDPLAVSAAVIRARGQA